jgi:XTP/dITP diphosphohydrolase
VKRLLLATRNRGKLRELQNLLGGEQIELLTLADHDGIGEIEETGSSFEENARIKASHAARAARLWTLGEDSGLEVDALGGQPGIFSARYAGAHGDDDANNAKLIRELAACENRSARYVCSLALARPGGDIVALTRGVCEGRIGTEAQGSRGFGYDPYFWPEATGNGSMAELEPQLKDAISHRGQALRAMLSLLRMHLDDRQEPASPREPELR